MKVSESQKKVVVLVYEYFYPGYLAGGPIQSLRNMVVELGSTFDFKVITSAFDLNAPEPYPGVRQNSWSNIRLPGTTHDIQVWYHDMPRIGRSVLLQLLREAQGDFVFINGLFTSWSTWPLLLNRTGSLRNTKLVVSPRGMLQEGALKVKPLKKKIYLSLLKLVQVFRGVCWHATDEQEKKDVQKIFGTDSHVVVAANIPKHPMGWSGKDKVKGQLRLVFLSLITEKKNLHVALEALKLVKTPISFHIYGPVKDQSYWEKCGALMKEQVHEIAYQRTLNSDEVQKKLASYDAFILPTKGENFGHAIYESLSVGTPAIISNYTPWGRLQDVHAGTTIETFDPKDWAMTIQTFIDLGQEEYSTYSKGAYQLAEDYFSKNDFKSQYQNLFST